MKARILIFFACSLLWLAQACAPPVVNEPARPQPGAQPGSSSGQIQTTNPVQHQGIPEGIYTGPIHCTQIITSGSYREVIPISTVETKIFNKDGKFIDNLGNPLIAGTRVYAAGIPYFISGVFYSENRAVVDLWFPQVGFGYGSGTGREVYTFEPPNIVRMTMSLSSSSWFNGQYTFSNTEGEAILTK